MIKTTWAQLLEQVARMMAVVGMSAIPLKAVGRQAYLQVRDPFRLSKDLRPERCPKI